MTRYLTAEAALEIVAQLGMGPVRDAGLLVSAIERPAVTVFGVDAYPGLSAKAAVLMESLIRNHALIDGNKRFGWVATVVFLSLNGVRLDAPHDEAFDLVVAVAAGERTTDEIEAALAAWCEPGGWTTGS